MTPEEHKKLDEISSNLYQLIGSIKGNGGKGMAGELQENTEKIDDMSKQLEHMQSVEGCIEKQQVCREMRKDEMAHVVQEALRSKGRNVWLVVKDIVLVLVAIVGLAVGSGIVPRLVNQQRLKDLAGLEMMLTELQSQVRQLSERVP